MAGQSGEKVFTDIHVHGVPGQGVTQGYGWRRALMALFAKQIGTRGMGPEAVRPYMDSLLHKLRQARYVRRAVLLALDQAYDKQGAPYPVRSGFWVRNQDVLAWCRSAPDELLFGASVHPRRPGTSCTRPTGRGR